MVGNSVTIDPRRHDAVLFDLSGPATALTERLRQAGVRVQAVSPGDDLLDAAAGLAVRPGRCVVITDNQSGVTGARGGGFALTVGVGLRDADLVLADLTEVTVRTGDRPMSALPDAWSALGAIAGASASPAVFFDFDGTLSDIVDDPGSARLVAGAAEALRALAAHCPVAVLSGRDLADVRQRVGLPGIWYAGSHGFELTGPDGSHHQNDAAAAAVPVLTDAAAALRTRLDAISGVVVEHKRFGVSAHYRNAARDDVGQVVAAVHAAAQRYGLRVTTGREVVELRPDVDWDKGRTLHWVIGRLAGGRPVLPVYLGDDITDEDAFDAVHGDGIGIIVRHTEDGDRRTAARFALDSPEQVSEFTAELARRLG